MWDQELESTSIEGPPTVGGRFFLKPRGGPKVAMRIEELSAPTRFVDVANLPLARMRTTHAFCSTASGTEVRVAIEIWGFLSPLWDRLVARKQAAGAATQTAAFLAYASGTP